MESFKVAAAGVLFLLAYFYPKLYKNQLPSGL